MVGGGTMKGPEKTWGGGVFVRPAVRPSQVCTSQRELWILNTYRLWSDNYTSVKLFKAITELDGKQQHPAQPKGRHGSRLRTGLSAGECS